MATKSSLLLHAVRAGTGFAAEDRFSTTDRKIPLIRSPIAGLSCRTALSGSPIAQDVAPAEAATVVDEQELIGFDPEDSHGRSADPNRLSPSDKIDKGHHGG
jgi:hypothetical protein